MEATRTSSIPSPADLLASLPASAKPSKPAAEPYANAPNCRVKHTPEWADGLKHTYQISKRRLSVYLFLHLACLGVIWVGWSWTAVGVCAALYLIRMFFVTGFYHRYFSHRAFKTNRFWQFVFAVCANSASQNGPLWWASHHRHHHGHTDMPDDEHSPCQHGLYWSHIGWLISKADDSTDLKRVSDLARFWELRVIDKVPYLIPFMLGTLLFFIGAGLAQWAPGLGTNGPQMLVWGFFISTVALFHATCTINSLSHVFGTQRFRSGDDSRNNFWLALLTMGEGWHNNHHYYPSAARQGFYWWEVDITYYLLKGLAAVGIIWDLRPVPEHVLREGNAAA